MRAGSTQAENGHQNLPCFQRAKDAVFGSIKCVVWETNFMIAPEKWNEGLGTVRQRLTAGVIRGVETSYAKEQVSLEG